MTKYTTLVLNILIMSLFLSHHVSSYVNKCSINEHFFLWNFFQSFQLKLFVLFSVLILEEEKKSSLEIPVNWHWCHMIFLFQMCQQFTKKKHIEIIYLGLEVKDAVNEGRKSSQGRVECFSIVDVMSLIVFMLLLFLYISLSLSNSLTLT